jgi:hypothetical protein
MSDSDVSFEDELEAALNSAQFRGTHAASSPGAAAAAAAADRRVSVAKPPPPPQTRAEERSRTLSDFSDDAEVAKQDLRTWNDVDARQLEGSALQLVQSIVATAPTDESIRDVAWQPLPQFLVAQEAVDPLGMGRLDLEHMRLVRRLAGHPACRYRRRAEQRMQQGSGPALLPGRRCTGAAGGA